MLQLVINAILITLIIISVASVILASLEIISPIGYIGVFTIIVVASYMVEFNIHIDKWLKLLTSDRLTFTSNKDGVVNTYVVGPDSISTSMSGPPGHSSSSSTLNLLAINDLASKM